MFVAAPGKMFRALWGDSPNSIFAVGDPPAYRYDGTAWNPMQGDVWGEHLWGSSSVDVYAVGWDYGAYHYDGHSWSQQYPVSNQDIYVAVGGTSASNVFVVGDGGIVSRYDGSTWKALNSGTGATLVDVWGASTTDVFIVGNRFERNVTFDLIISGTVLRYKP